MVTYLYMKGDKVSFEKLKVGELREIAAAFGVDDEEAKNKAEVIAVLKEEGVTYDDYVKFRDAEKASDEELDDFLPYQPSVRAEPADPTGTVLVKMERANSLYQIDNYVFTSEHPFIAMSEDDAQEIFDREEGFRLATPNEVKSYYA